MAAFALESYSYSAGAAHGMQHVEYVNFDLKAKKRLLLQDVLLKGAEAKVLDSLFDANAMWLASHDIDRAAVSSATTST